MNKSGFSPINYNIFKYFPQFGLIDMFRSVLPIYETQSHPFLKIKPSVVQCLTWIPLTHTVLLVDSGKIFDRKDKIAIFENMTSKISLLQYIVPLFTF